MGRQTLQLTDQLYDYLLVHSLREPAVLRRLREITAELPMSRMQVAPEQGQFMAFLVELIGAKKALEIGVFTGYSSLAVALALPADGKLIACDINQSWTDIAKRFWHEAGVTDKIDLHLAPALKTLDQLLPEQSNTFDFIFIDADKSNYPNYYEKSLQLLRVGGLMAIDNVLQDGRVADPTIEDKITVVMRELNRQIQQDSRVSMTLVPIGDGLMLVRKR